MNTVSAEGHVRAYTLPEVYRLNLWGAAEADGYLASGGACARPYR